LRQPIQWRAMGLLCLVLGVGAACGQAVPAESRVFDATDLHEPTDPTTPWLVKAGDDLAWAQPGFDDSQWKVFDDTTAVSPLLGGAHPDVVWYRLHVKLGPGQTGFAIREYYLASAFEIYADGKKILGTGRVAPFKPQSFSATLIAPVPESAVKRGEVVIALRVHVAKKEWSGAFGGLYSTNIRVGTEHALRDQFWLETLGGAGTSWVIDLFGLGLGMMALVLYLGQREQKEYLWLFLMMFTKVLQDGRDGVESFRNVPLNWDYSTLPLDFAFLLFTVMVFFAFLRIRPALWLRIYLAVALAVFGLLFIGVTTGEVTRQLQLIGILPIIVLQYVIIPILLIVKWRDGNGEAGILLIPSLILSVGALISFTIQGLGLIPSLTERMTRLALLLNGLPVGPLRLSAHSLANLLFYFSLTLIVVLRASRVSRQQAVLEHEMEAARAVQQVIVPEHVGVIRGFTVETAYEPAQQVGGDFFQVMPDGAGGLLLVLGDVAGHGLPAAMLVSVLVGAVRAAADFTKDPAEILTNLNERLVGRTHGSFSTALTGRITADGWVTVANAGHLSPYMDGVEMELPGALPLGVAGDARYETSRFWLAPGGRLTFYSDGVVEARAAGGELFGFERAQAISTVGAAEIVAAAKRFGQEDDITVVTVVRDRAVAVAA
jgi:sigma-B regulation protein RsbU (phosphoserine phosphatase)